MSLVLIGGLLGVPGQVAAQETTPTHQSITVHVHDDGDATLVMQFEYDLTTPSEQAAFETISSNETVIATTKAQFTSRMRAVAAAITNTTHRTVHVTATRISFTQEGNTGVVTLAADVSNLARQTSDGTLVLSAPFANGFAFDGTVRVVAPDGYVIASATPTADRAPSSGVRVWNASTSLTGFTVTIAPQDAASASTTATQTPGMGVVALLVSIVASIGVILANKR